MKKRISAFIVAFMMVISCTTTINAINTKDTITNHEYINYIADQFDITYENILKEEYTHNYYTGYVSLCEVQRADALIGLMRVYKLIPDFDTIELYEWTDIPASKNYSDIELAYISYARELGITSGTSEFTFSFNTPITKNQLNTFNERINQLENLEDLQVNSPLEVYDHENSNCNIFVEPLLIEVLMQLPENVYTKLINDDWRIKLVHEENMNVNGSLAIGATYYDTRQIDIITHHGMTTSFYITMVHELAHAIDSSCNWKLVNGVTPDTEILNEEKPKLAKNYRSYANTNTHEFIACVFEYIAIYGIEEFKDEYPLTYEWINSQIRFTK